MLYKFDSCAWRSKTITEDTEWNPEKPHSDYAISKYGAEIEVWRGYQEGLPIVIVNPGVILGPGFWETGSGEIFSKVKKGLLFYTKGITGFVTVNDVVKIATQLMKSNINGERCVVIAKNISFETILTTIAKAFKVKSPSIYAKPWITEIVWRLDWIASTFFNSKRRLSKDMAQSIHSENYISSEKVKKDLDFTFQNVEVYCSEVVTFFKE
jgi:dihydroflavonol-4-reductase